MRAVQFAGRAVEGFFAKEQERGDVGLGGAVVLQGTHGFGERVLVFGDPLEEVGVGNAFGVVIEDLEDDLVGPGRLIGVPRLTVFVLDLSGPGIAGVGELFVGDDERDVLAVDFLLEMDQTGLIAVGGGEEGVAGLDGHVLGEDWDDRDDDGEDRHDDWHVPFPVAADVDDGIVLYEGR